MKKYTTYIPHNHHNKKIRIIGGKWRGKKIAIINHPKLRPTPDRIKETLFNWLITIIPGSNCLDCFAGTGALGLEALSRHANQVTFLEKNITISKKLKQTIRNLNAQQQSEIITTDTKQWLINSKIHNTQQRYNVIFLDPPFKPWNIVTHTIQLLKTFQYLSQKTWIYIEHTTKNTNLRSFIPNHWILYKKKQTKNISYQLYLIIKK